MKRHQFRLRYILVALWGAFSVTLTGWWIYFGISQIDKLLKLDAAEATKLAGQQRMLLWEGSVLVFLLFVGAGAIAYYMYRELKETRRIKEFFSVFSHEIKTPLSSILLNTELLNDKIQNPAEREIAQRLLKDIERLSLQVENSLFLAQGDKSEILTEQIKISDVVHSIQQHIPELAVVMTGDAMLEVDRRAIQSILLNIACNASIHGKAKKLEIQVKENTAAGNIELALQDDGQGFKGDRRKLGSLFHRPYPGSGSGIGLHLAQNLCRLMRGQLHFNTENQGFGVKLLLPGTVL